MREMIATKKIIYLSVGTAKTGRVIGNSEARAEGRERERGRGRGTRRRCVTLRRDQTKIAEREWGARPWNASAVGHGDESSCRI